MEARQGGPGRALNMMDFLEVVPFRGLLDIQQVRQFQGYVLMRTSILTGVMNHIILLAHIR